MHHVMTAVLEQKVDSPMHKALDEAGIDEVKGITSISEKRIEVLKFMDALLTSLSLQACPQVTSNLSFVLKHLFMTRSLEA